MMNQQVRHLAEALEDEWLFHDHALLRMQERDISYEDVAYAMWNMACFEYSRRRNNMNLNIWGADPRGRKLRITLIPECRVIETVAIFHQWSIGDYLRLKAESISDKPQTRRGSYTRRTSEDVAGFN